MNEEIFIDFNDIPDESPLTEWDYQEICERENIEYSPIDDY